MTTLQIETAPLDSLVLDPRNPRSHDERSIEAIKRSLVRFGQQKPIVIDADNVVVAGNGFVVAARELGWTELSVVRSTLSGNDRVAYAIADNRTAEVSEWDYQTLSGLIKELQGSDYDLEPLGFADYELQPLLEAEWSPPAINDDESVRGGTKPIQATVEQRQTIDRAIEVLRRREEDNGISEGRAVELICADWLSGADLEAGGDANPVG